MFIFLYKNIRASIFAFIGKKIQKVDFGLLIIIKIKPKMKILDIIANFDIYI